MNHFLTYILLIILHFATSTVEAMTSTSTSTDTLDVAYTYWWSEAGPFIGLCGDKYALVVVGEITTINSASETQNDGHVKQEGVIKIHEVMVNQQLPKQSYQHEQFLKSDGFYDSKLTIGDKVIMFCYAYEGRLAMPGAGAIVKIEQQDDPRLSSIKKYIKSDQNALTIKDDVSIWEEVGHGKALIKILACAKNGSE